MNIKLEMKYWKNALFFSANFLSEVPLNCNQLQGGRKKQGTFSPGCVKSLTLSADLIFPNSL